MKFVLSVLLLFCLANQKINTGKYQINIESEQVNCELNISPDSTYEIQLCFQETEDMVYCAVLSYGHYSYTNEQLVLHDDYYNFDWNIFIRDKTLIKVNQGYAFLDGKRIVDYQNENVRILPPSENYQNAIKSAIYRFKAQQDNPQLIPGQYEDQNQRYLLKIENDGSYLLFLKDMLLSKGSWNRQNNDLIFNDDDLNHNFTMAIGNRTLLSMGIPGEFGGTMFKNINTKNIPKNKTIIPLKKLRGGCSRIKNR